MQELGAAGLTKRPTSCMLVLPPAHAAAADEEAKDYAQTYEDVFNRVKHVQPIY